MSAVKSRAKAAILGGFVADAATMPLHWIYDVEKIKELVGDKNPEFFSPPSCPFYTYELGEDKTILIHTSLDMRLSMDRFGYECLAHASAVPLHETLHH
jgi:hypothetical protein